jgi:hypothetical protein
MKKLTILLALVLLATTAFALDVTTVGRFTWFGNWNSMDQKLPMSSGDISYGRIGWDLKVDDFNTVNVRLRAEGITDWGVSDFYLKNFKLVTDITGALGLDLPITVKSTVGLFDTYFTGWWYASMSGWEHYYGGANALDADTGEFTTGMTWSNMLVNAGQVHQGAVQLDVGVMEKVTLHGYTDLTGRYVMLGADAAFGPAALWVAYGAEGEWFGKGDLSIEAKVDLPEFVEGLTIGVYPYFRLGFDKVVPIGFTAKETPFTWGVGLGTGYKIFHLAAGVQGDNVAALDHMIFEASVVPIEAAKVWVSAFVDTNSGKADSLMAIDIAGSYNLGAAKVILGYIIGGKALGTSNFSLPLYGDNAWYSNGFYFGFDCSF